MYKNFLIQETTKEAGVGEEEGGEKPKQTTGGKVKKLTNQFNFSERASQSYNYPCRVVILILNLFCYFYFSSKGSRNIRRTNATSSFQ